MNKSEPRSKFADVPFLLMEAPVSCNCDALSVIAHFLVSLLYHVTSPAEVVHKSQPHIVCLGDEQFEQTFIAIEGQLVR